MFNAYSEHRVGGTDRAHGAAVGGSGGRGVRLHGRCSCRTTRSRVFLTLLRVCLTLFRACLALVWVCLTLVLSDPDVANTDAASRAQIGHAVPRWEVVGDAVRVSMAVAKRMR